MKISIVIPVYNASLTLKECLDAIFDTSFKDFEVIVVSDKSTDDSVQIAKQYQCKIIELPENKGPAFARNAGAKVATGDILLFVDSDVIIEKKALISVAEKFSNREINVIQGIYSHQPTYKNVATQYQQSFYCYYSWHKDIKYTSSLITNCFAIRRDIFNEVQGFNVKIKSATSEDEEFGYVLLKKGYKILIVRELVGEHRVNYNLWKVIKRNFAIYIDTTKTYLRNKTYVEKVKQANYWNILIGIPIFGLILLTLFIIVFTGTESIWSFFLLLNIIFILLHFRFINFVLKEKGTIMSIGVMMFCYLDAFIMLASLLYGSLSYFFKKKY